MITLGLFAGRFQAVFSYVGIYERLIHLLYLKENFVNVLYFIPVGSERLF